MTYTIIQEKENLDIQANAEQRTNCLKKKRGVKYLLSLIAYTKNGVADIIADYTSVINAR
jgi:hypothetical protein